MSNPLSILQHSLGLDAHGCGRQYRNHFVTGDGCDDLATCHGLVARGLMMEHSPSALSGGDSIFMVTAAGIEHVALTSPQRPPAEKFNRSQKRYRDWLNADCGMPFAQWIGVGLARHG